MIALDKPPDRTPIREVMTAEFATVSTEESAMEALGIMLQNKTRHLTASVGGRLSHNVFFLLAASFIYGRWPW